MYRSAECVVAFLHFPALDKATYAGTLEEQIDTARTMEFNIPIVTNEASH
jgi:hypothetical protein